jgi:tetratricopeptide (TPR) repeat protein
VLLAAALVLTAATTTLIGVRTHLAATQKRLEEEEDQKRSKAFRAGTEQALLLINAVTPLQDHLPQGLEVCEETLRLYGILDRDDWQSQPAWQRLNPADRQRLGEDAQELLLLLAWARVRAAAGQDTALRDALHLLDQAEAMAGLPPSAALWHERGRYQQLLGDTTAAQLARARAQELPPTSARDHYLLATTHLRGSSSADQAQALAELNRAIGLNPHNFWSWFRRGLCHLQREDYQLAAGDFGVCVGLWPQFAWGHFNLGYAHSRSGRKEEAILNYTAALACDPAFVDAYLNRALAYLELQLSETALLDFDQAVALRPDDAALHAGRGLALEGLGRPADADEAFRQAFARLASAPAVVQEHTQVSYGFAVRQRLPHEARTAFDQVLGRNPQHREALYGRALLAVEQGQSAEAVGILDRCIAAAPEWMEPRRHRAIQLARCGRFAEAIPAIQACLDREPHGGATLYAAACVHARAAAAASDEKARLAAREKALAFLARAFVQNHGQAEAATDPDLAAIRDQVQKLLAPHRQRPQ